MNTTNCNNIESNNGMSQVINILTGETKKIRCHYLSKRTDKPVSRDADSSTRHLQRPL